jgi:predicted MFS family arabinose efflux permease
VSAVVDAGNSTGAGRGLDSGWRCTIAATALIALVVGSRSAFGLYLSPINTATGLGLATLGFAAALGQLGQGVAQPLVGMLAERHGAARVITAGGIGLGCATALIASAVDAVALAALILLSGIAGTAMGSIAMLLGEVGRRVPAGRQGLAIGIVGAGGSAGQLLFGPMTQTAIELAGWVQAMWLTAGLSLLALPLALVFRRPLPAAPASSRPGEDDVDSGGVGSALRQPAFWLIAGGFAVCGFHMSFLTMHIPGVIERCGLPPSLAGTWLAVLGVTNIAGSLVIGLMLKRYPPALLLTVLHALRAGFIAVLLAVPASPGVMLAFAAAMGATYMAALPPTTVLVRQAFGARRIGTLFGLVMLLHQIGSFAGVWLGGVAADSADGYRTLWLLDIGLALLAAAMYLPFTAAATAARISGSRDRSACAAAAAPRSAQGLPG